MVKRSSINIEDVIAFYKSGNFSVPQTAEKFGIGKTTVVRWLKTKDVRIRTFKEVMSGRKLSDEHKKKVSQYLINGDRAIAKSNPNWKGGKSWAGRNKDNSYVIIRIGNKYIKEHRYVMEKHLERRLLTQEEVHHKDGNKKNNSIDNLIILSKSEHAKLHNNDLEFKKNKSEKSKQARANKYWSTKKKTL